MATHTLVYYGYFDASFHRLVPGQDRYWKKGETSGIGSPVAPPPKEFDGIKFGFMEGMKSYFVIRVNELLLPSPVLFVGGRHGPTAPGPAWANLDDDVASQILVDAILANPGFRDVLAQQIRKLES